VINTSRQIGAGIGAALLPAIALTVSHGGATAGVSGDRAAMLAGAVAAGLATLIAVAHRTEAGRGGRLRPGHAHGRGAPRRGAARAPVARWKGLPQDTWDGPATTTPGGVSR
jgi:hypothetical protein